MSKKNRIIATVVALFSMLAIGGGVAFAVTSTKPAPGVQSNGTFIACIHTSTPHTVHAFIGKTTASACPTGYAKASWNLKGQTGATGAKGSTGAAGINAQALPYGVALVNVARGSGSATTWAKYSTTIGSPVGDTASGTFRFTCSAANAPCTVSAQAYATVDGVKVYPRLDITRQTLSADTMSNCEYADGTDNDGGSKTVGQSPTNLTLGVGSTQSCGDQATSTSDASVGSVKVPSGYYDVSSTFVFAK